MFALEEIDSDGMPQMSFLEHLEELRGRILSALAGLAVAFVLSMTFAGEMWLAVKEPAAAALQALGYRPVLIFVSPTQALTVIYMKLPLLAAIFLSSPWTLWQIWRFIAPGLYREERRLAGPIVVSAALLFVIGGLFAYFIAFRFGLEFLLGIGRGDGLEPALSVVDYTDMFVNVTLGVGVLFELPMVIFLLSLLRIVTAGYLVRHSRYAILAIVTLAALITPTLDIFNLALFAVPMILLFFVGVFAAYLLERRRDRRQFPWLPILIVLLAVGGSAAGIVAALVLTYGYKLTLAWPFLGR